LNKAIARPAVSPSRRVDDAARIAHGATGR